MRWFNQQPKRTELQERALNTALRIYNSDPEKYKDTMFCPYCGQPLIPSGNKRRMQTLGEHVCHPNDTPSLKDEYICSADGLFEGRYLFDNDPDSQIGCEFGILHSWNGGIMSGVESGGSYTSDYRTKLHELSKESIINKRVIDEWLHEDYKHQHSAALNTFECESQTSCYKTGLKDHVRLPALITLNLIQLIINYSYQADNFGRVTKTWIHLGFLKRRDKGEDFSIVGSWPWSTWRYLNRRSRTKWKYRCKDSSKIQFYEDLMEYFAPSMNDAWIYRLHQWYLTHVKHPIIAKKTLRYFGIDEFVLDYKIDDIVRNHES